MFLDFYKLRDQPFGETPDPRYLYLSPTHREAIASLAYGIEARRGFLGLVAEPGMGKTTVLFHLLEWLRGSARTAFLFQTQCNSRELLCYLLADLGIDTHGKEPAWMHERLKEVLVNEASAGRRLVVFIDEAHNLSESALETVRLLSDFENAGSKLIQVVLAGQPQLADKLARPELAQLRQRVSVLSRLSPFTRSETDEYINHRLSIAGSERVAVFTPEARAMIASWSRGVPRDINNVCFNSLSLGYAMGKDVVDLSVVREATSDLEVCPSVKVPHDSHPSDVDVVPWSAASLFGSKAASSEREISSGSQLAPPPRPELEVCSSVKVPLDSHPSDVDLVPWSAASLFGSKAASSEREISSGSQLAPPPRPELEVVVRSTDAPSKNAVSPLMTMAHFSGGTMLFLAVVLVALLVVKAAGSFFFNHVMAQPAVTTFAPMPQVLEAKAPPVKRAQNLAAGLKPSQSRFKTNPASAAKALDGKLLGSPADLSRSDPNRSSQPTPPDLTGVPTDVPSEGVGSVHPGSSNVLLTPRLTPEESAPVQVGGRLKEPHLAFKVDPIYPAMARQTNVEGEVVIHAVIDASGKPTQLKVVSGPTLLQDAALDSVRQWQYEPSYLDGEPVPAGIFIPVNFRLH